MPRSAASSRPPSAPRGQRGYPCRPHGSALPPPAAKAPTDQHSRPPDLKARTIIRREQLHGKVQDDVIRDVRREIADAQLLPPALFVREPRRGADHRRI